MTKDERQAKKRRGQTATDEAHGCPSGDDGK
jgi:hypothetical protein